MTANGSLLNQTTTVSMQLKEPSKRLRTISSVDCVVLIVNFPSNYGINSLSKQKSPLTFSERRAETLPSQHMKIFMVNPLISTAPPLPRQARELLCTTIHHPEHHGHLEDPMLGMLAQQRTTTATTVSSSLIRMHTAPQHPASSSHNIASITPPPPSNMPPR